MAQASVTIPALQVLDAIIVPALERIGRYWERGEAALSQVYMSGRIIESLSSTLLPTASRPHPQHTTLAIAVLDDFHFLGKNLVLSILHTGGFDLIDLGHVDVDGLVERVRNGGIEVLLISTLMLPSALRVREVRDKLMEAGQHVKIVVGGAPFRFDPELWREVGADGCGQNATEALAIVRSLVKTRVNGEAEA
jgi:methanogenic corrinoid protein MtbC1